MLMTHKLTPNQYYLMWAIEDGVTTPLINTKLELRNLKNKGYMLEDGKLTDKAKRIVKEVDGFFKRKKKKTDKAIMGDGFEANMVRYNEIFKKERLKSGRNARSALSNVAPGLRWFFENNDYTWEEVFEGTRLYNEEQELKGKDYMTCSQYFVRKQQTDKTWISMLADWCQSVRDGLDSPDQSHFKENVF